MVLATERAREAQELAEQLRSYSPLHLGKTSRGYKLTMYTAVMARRNTVRTRRELIMVAYFSGGHITEKTLYPAETIVFESKSFIRIIAWRANDGREFIDAVEFAPGRWCRNRA
jgi:hypothetical protein